MQLRLPVSTSSGTSLARPSVNLQADSGGLLPFEVQTASIPAILASGSAVVQCCTGMMFACPLPGLSLAVQVGSASAAEWASTPACWSC